MNEWTRGVLLGLSLVLAATARGGEGTAVVVGRVVERGSPDPVPAAAIISGTVLIAETDLEGRFTVTVTAGEIHLTLRAAGFEDVTRVFSLKSGDTGQLTQSLKRDTVISDE